MHRRHLSHEYRPSSPERQILAEAHGERNPVTIASINIDKNVRRLQGYGEQMTDIPDLSSEIGRMKDDASAVIERHYLDSERTWTDIYRLIAKRQLLEHIIYAPLFFRFGENSTNEMRAGRETLANGLLGLHTEIIANALEEYHHPGASDDDRDQLVGVINEHTSMALINFDQDPDVIALPALTADDIAAKTDIVRYSVSRRGYKMLPIQVKSSEPPKEKRRRLTPKGGILVTGTMMGNSREGGLRTSHALVEVVNNANSPDREAHEKHLMLSKEYLAANIARMTGTTDAGRSVSYLSAA